MIKKIFLVFCFATFAFFALTLMNPNTALADSYDGSGNVTIDTPFTTGDLSSAITAAHSTLADITGLTITAGELNAADFYWIRDNVRNLATFIVEGAATIEKGIVPDEAFYNYSISSHNDKLAYIKITSATSIGTMAFRRCEALTTVDMPLVTVVGEFAFRSCNLLATINMPLLEEVNQEGFISCSALTILNFTELQIIGKSSFASCSGVTTVNLPKVTSVGDYAFSRDGAITNLQLPEATLIGENAFYQCTDLTSVLLPKVIEVKESGFQDCTLLHTITLPEATTIGPHAFYQCTALENVNLPKATTLDIEVFYECYSLKNISLPKATSIGGDCFESCTNLESVDLPEATSLGDEIFEDCVKLSSVNIPKITTLPDYAFYNCDALVNINMPSITSIGKYAFYYCDGLVSVSFPLIESIPEEAFFRCTNLTTVNFPKVKYIGKRAFASCGKLNNTSFPMLHTIGESSFDGAGLTEAVFPNVISLGSSAFKDCYYITEIDFPNLAIVPADAFNYCEKLTDVSLPKVISVGERGFRECTSLLNVSLPMVETLGNRAFYTCHLLEQAFFPRLEFIGDEAFEFTSLNSLTLGQEVPSVGAEAFKDISSTRAVHIPAVSAKDFENDSSDGNTTDNYWFGFQITPNGGDSYLCTLSGWTVTTSDGTSISNVNEMNVPYDAKTATISVTPDSNSATIVGDGKHSLSIGENKFVVIVTSGNGLFTKEYPITIHRAKGKGDRIESFVFKVLDPDAVGDIDHDKHMVTVYVPYGTNRSKLVPAIKISESASISPQSGVAQNFSSPVSYIVTAQDGSKQTYEVTVIRGNKSEPDESEDATLKYIKIDGVQMVGFDSSILSYTLNVPYSLNSTLVEAVANNDEALISGGIGTQNLSIGKNTLSIVVLAEDGVSELIYQIVINRAANDDATLKSLMIDGVMIAGFDPTKTTYEMKVDKDIESVLIGYIPNGFDTLFTTTYHVVPGKSVCNITIEPKEGEFRQAYTITFDKEKVEETEKLDAVIQATDSNDVTSHPQMGLSRTQIIVLICCGIVLIICALCFTYWYQVIRRPRSK